MKLEEALPLYRAGKRIISNDDTTYSIEPKVNECRLLAANEKELLGEWTLKEEPAKYSIYVWVNKKPSPQENHGHNLGTRLFGDVSWHLSSNLDRCQRRLRVTVEEVEDEKV